MGGEARLQKGRRVRDGLDSWEASGESQEVMRPGVDDPVGSAGVSAWTKGEANLGKRQRGRQGGRC